MKRLQGLLRQVGLEPERIQMFHMSSAMASQFVEAANQMAEQVAALGPNPLTDVENNWKELKTNEETDT